MAAQRKVTQRSFLSLQIISATWYEALLCGASPDLELDFNISSPLKLMKTGIFPLDKWAPV